MGSSCATAMIIMATILGPITLVFMAVSFGTDHWLKFNVNRDDLTGQDMDAKHSLYSHSRHSGLFRVCYPGNETSFLDNMDNLVDGYCLEMTFDMPAKTTVSAEYLDRIHLLRLWLAFFIIALVFFVVAFVVGLVLCCVRVSRWAYIAGLCAYISAFCLAGAIAFFHGAEYMERNKLPDQAFYMAWPQGIRDATERRYGWSYALGWVGMILATLSATFYSIAGCYIAAARYEDRERLEKEPYRGRGDYPMYTVDDPYVIKPQPVYASEYAPSHHAYPGPYLVAADTMPRYMPDQSPRDVWNIQEVR